MPKDSEHDNSQKDSIVYENLKSLVQKARSEGKVVNAYVPIAELAAKCQWPEKIVNESLARLERARRVKKIGGGRNQWTLELSHL
jgi:hypothetical protein